MKLTLRPEVEEIWPCMRLFLEGRVTWTELEEVMTIDDVDDILDTIDEWRAASRRGRTT